MHSKREMVRYLEVVLAVEPFRGEICQYLPYAIVEVIESVFFSDQPMGKVAEMKVHVLESLPLEKGLNGAAFAFWREDPNIVRVADFRYPIPSDPRLRTSFRTARIGRNQYSEPGRQQAKRSPR